MSAITADAPLNPSLLMLHYYQAAAIESFVRLVLEMGPGVRGIITLPTGCVDGDAEVRVSRAGKGFGIKLSRLHDMFNGAETKNHKRWDPGIPTYIRSNRDGVIGLQQVMGVLDKGVRPVVKIKLLSGKELRVTGDHEVAAPDRWIRADALIAGQLVLTNGVAACRLCEEAPKAPNRMIVGKAAKFKGYCLRCMKRRLSETALATHNRNKNLKGGYLSRALPYHPRSRPSGVPEHQLVIEADMNGYSLQEWVEICRHNKFTSAHKFLSNGTIVHHIDGDKQNNGRENLEVIHNAKEHSRRHAREDGIFLRLDGGIGGKGGAVIFRPKLDEVVSVRPDGEAHVYDVVCADPHRNFIANGIVVHNCGKTITGLEMAYRMGRTLWLAHRSELISQPLEEANTFWPNREYGIVKATENNFSARDIVFGSVDSTAQDRRISGLLASHEHNPFKLIVVDECQHAIKDSRYAAVLNAFPKVPGCGLTATPERSDGISLAPVFVDGLIYRLPLKAAIAGKYLVPPSDGEGHLNRAKRLILPNFKPSDIPTSKDGDYDQKALEKAMLDCHAGKALAEAAAYAVKRGRKPIVFTMSIAISKEVVSTLVSQFGITAKHIDGTIPEKERAAILAGHKANEFSVLSNCSVLTEGYNDRAVTCMIMGKPTKSRPLYIQMLGRGLRAYPGKTDCLVIDVCGVDAAHGLQTADTVMDDEPKPPPKKKKKADSIGLPPTPDDMIARLRKLLEYVSGQSDVEADQEVQQAIEWVPIPGTAAFALDARDAGFIMIEPRPGGRYDVVCEPKDMKLTPTLITPEPTTIEIAQAIGENYVRSAGEMRVVKRDAFWRRKPATPGQLKYLNSLGVRLDPVEEENMTMGVISRLITQHSGKIRMTLRPKRVPIHVKKSGFVSDF